MGKLENGFRFIGKLGPYTAYKVKGSDEIFVKTRPGKSGRKLKDLSPRVKENVTEFSLRSTGSKAIRAAMKEILHLSDYNFTSDLNSRGRDTQVLDTTSARGERGILISQHPQYYIGFNLNKRFLFDSIIRRPVRHTIDPSKGTATIDLPALEPGINLLLSQPVPTYRIIMVLGLAADQLFHTEERHRWFWGRTVVATTGPLNSGQVYPAQQFELALPLPEQGPKDGALSYVLSIGIEIEIPDLKKRKMVKTGSSKILDIVAAVV
jgi:hypothetical protein